jgi:hypothetical protein
MLTKDEFVKVITTIIKSAERETVNDRPVVSIENVFNYLKMFADYTGNLEITEVETNEEEDLGTWNFNF